MQLAAKLLPNRKPLTAAASVGLELKTEQKNFATNLEKQLKCSSSKKRQVWTDVFAGLNVHPLTASMLRLFLSVQKIILVGRDCISPVPRSVRGQLDEVGCKAFLFACK